MTTVTLRDRCLPFLSVYSIYTEVFDSKLDLFKRFRLFYSFPFSLLPRKVCRRRDPCDVRRSHAWTRCRSASGDRCSTGNKGRIQTDQFIMLVNVSLTYNDEAWVRFGRESLI